MDDLEFSRFHSLVTLIRELNQDDAKERMINSVFIGWQMGAGGDKTFGQYLQHFGLKDPDAGEGSMDITKDEAIKKAEKIQKAIRSKKK